MNFTLADKALKPPACDKSPPMMTQSLRKSSSTQAITHDHQAATMFEANSTSEEKKMQEALHHKACSVEAAEHNTDSPEFEPAELT